MTISIMSAKGGVGKTSITIALASYLAHQGKKILVIDANPQADATNTLAPDDIKEDILSYQNTLAVVFHEDKDLPIYETDIKNLHLCAGHERLYFLSSGDKLRLKTHIEKIKSQYDYIFIDTTNFIGTSLVSDILFASNATLLVTSPGKREIRGIDKIYNKIQELIATEDLKLSILGCVLNMYRDNHAATRLTYNELSNHEIYKTFLCRTMIPRSEKDNTSNMYDRDTYSSDPGSIFSKAIQGLSTELSL